MYNIPFYEASAKDNISIDDFMKKIINEVVDNLSSQKKGIGLDADNYTKNKRGNCSC